MGVWKERVKEIRREIDMDHASIRFQPSLDTMYGMEEPRMPSKLSSSGFLSLSILRK